MNDWRDAPVQGTLAPRKWDLETLDEAAEDGGGP
jgi:hypothetical protein